MRGDGERIAGGGRGCKRETRGAGIPNRGGRRSGERRDLESQRIAAAPCPASRALVSWRKRQAPAMPEKHAGTWLVGLEDQNGDVFDTAHSDTHWRDAIGYAVKIGLGSADYELVRI